MRSSSGESDATAVFEALCRVERQTSRSTDAKASPRAPRAAATDGAPPAAPPSGGPAAALSLFLRELGAVSGPEDDDLPDFSRESPPAAEPEPSPPIAGDRDAIVRGLLRTIGSYQGLLDRYNHEFDEVFARRARGEAEGDDETLRRLRGVQNVLVKYPIAGQAAFLALVREGRRFAETDEGRAWKRRLQGSPLLAKARTLFEGLANGMVGEGDGALPSAYADALLRALDRDIERVLADAAGVETDR